MQSRMDKYNSDLTQARSRIQKNKDLYESVRNSSLTDFDVNSNVSVIDDQADVIDLNRIKNMLDTRYNTSQPKRRSIEIPDYEEPKMQEQLVDTKEYDINAILAKAKQGKNVDYNKERLKKVRETQLEILEGLDLELKKIDDSKNTKRKQDEENLMNLINTITALELQNKNKSKEESEALDLLDLDDDEETEEVVEEIVEKQPEKETEVELSQEIEIIEQEEKEEIKEEKTRDDHIEETLSKLNIDISSYDEFKDIAKNDVGSIVLKIVIFIIVIALVIGGVYIVDDLLALGLF